MERKGCNTSRSFPSAIWSSTQSLFSRCSHVSDTVLCVRPQWRRQRTQPRCPPARVNCLKSVEKERRLVGTVENVQFPKVAYTFWGWEQSADQLHKHRAGKALFWRGLRKVGSRAPGAAAPHWLSWMVYQDAESGRGNGKAHRVQTLTAMGSN